MVRDIDDTLFIATTAYDQVNNSSFIEILKLDPNDVLVAKLDIEPSVGQNIQVFHINNGHDGNLCITGLVEEAGRNHIYAAILSSSLTILHEKYYEYPNSGQHAKLHSQGHFIMPNSGGGYMIGGMATDGYNFNQSEMLDSKVGIVMSVGYNLNFGVASLLDSRFDCSHTLPLGSSYLHPMTKTYCDNNPDPTDDYDLVDQIIEYEPMKFLVTGSVNVPHVNSSNSKDFDQGVLFYGLNVGCGTGPPYALCMGFEFNMSFTSGLGASFNEDENAVETIYYPNTDEAVILVNSGQRHGLVLKNWNNISSAPTFTSGLEIQTFISPFEWAVASSMKEAINTPTPDGVVIGGQFRKTSYTFPTDTPGTYNHSFPFIFHVDRKDSNKTQFLKTYPLRSHDFEAHFPNNMNHLLARGIENVPFTFTPPSLLTKDFGSINRKTELLMYKIEPSKNLSQLGKFSVNYSGATECMQHIDINPGISSINQFYYTTLIDQELVWFTQHPIQSPTESRDLIEEPCIAE